MTTNEKQLHLVDGDVPLTPAHGSIIEEKGSEPTHLDHLEDFLEADIRTALDISPEEQKRIWRKVDMHIIWPMALIYLLQYSDKSVIGNAKIEGLLTELNISSSQYTWVLSIFYFSYGLFEMPSNLLLKKFKASYWMSGLCLAFGLNLALMGLCTNYAGLLVARLALGFTTAGVFPGAAYYFSTWYPRHMMAWRFSFFFSSATLAGAFAGLLASAIRNLHGRLGHQGWSWIFIIFGCLGILGGFVTFPFIHRANSPEEATFLTDKEKAFVKACLAQDAGYTRTSGEATRLNFKEWKAVFVDWQTYSWTFQYFCACTPLFSLAIFVPSIISGLGYKGTQAQLLGVPTFASAIPFVILSAWLSDRYKKRGYVMAVGYTTALIGWLMLLKCETTGARYAGTFIVSIGQWPISAPSIMATTNSFAGQTKRATAVGLICGVGNLCGIITAQIFRTEWAPRYIPAIHGMICFNVMGLAQTLVLLYVYKAINARRQRICDKGINYTHEELQEMGDKAPTFRYIF